MARWILVAFGVIALPFLGGLHLLSAPGTATADAPVGPAFSGKPLVVMAKDGVAYTLEKAEVRQLGGRAFLVGREMKDSPYKITKERFGGATVWVPVDAVTEMVELEPRKREK